MFHSLIQALGLDSSFFIQFLIFCLLYPVIQRGLILPFYRLHQERERQTSQKIQKAQALKQQIKHLQKEYEQRAGTLHQDFQKLYDREQARLFKSFSDLKNQSLKTMEKEHQMQKQKLYQEFRQAEREVKREIKPLAERILNRLNS